MDKRKETVTEILNLLDGLSYYEIRQILNVIVSELENFKLNIDSNTTGQSGNLAKTSRLSKNFWAEVVRERCDKCPGRDVRYSAFLAEL